MNIVAIIGILIGLGIMAPSLFKKIKGNTYTYGVNATYLGFDVEEEDENGLSKRISLKFRYKLFEKEYEVKCKKTYILSVTQFEAFFNKNGLVENGNKFIYVNPMKPSECSLVGGSAQSPLPIYIGGAIVLLCLIGGVVSPIIKRTNENKVEDSAVAENLDNENSEDDSDLVADVSDEKKQDENLNEDQDEESEDGKSKEIRRPSTDTVMGVIAFAASYTDSPKRDNKEADEIKKGSDSIIKGEAYKNPLETTITKSFVEEYLSVSENSIEGVNSGDAYAPYSVLRAQMKCLLEDESNYLVSGKDYSGVFAEAKEDGKTKAMGSTKKDLDEDGVDELIFGDGSGEKGVIYNIYTLKDGSVNLLIDGDKDHRIYLCKNGLVAIESTISETESSIAYLYFYKGNFYIHKVLFYDETKPEKSRWSCSTTSISDKSNAVEISDEQAEKMKERYAYKQVAFTGFVN